MLTILWNFISLKVFRELAIGNMIIFILVTLLTKLSSPQIVITPEIVTFGVKIPMPNLFSALEKVQTIAHKLETMWQEEYKLSIPK